MKISSDWRYADLSLEHQQGFLAGVIFIDQILFHCLELKNYLHDAVIGHSSDLKLYSIQEAELIG
jgi:hypothetical protein